MTFAAPLQLAWLGLLVPLVVLYILRRKREQRVVGSTLLWESALRDLRAESPFRRLVPHLSLLLQALVVVLGALALARPSGAARMPEGAHVAFVVDTSLSMGAAAVDDSARQAPLERARRLIQRRAANLPPGGRALVIAAGTSPALLTTLTSERASLVRAADALGVTCPVADVGAALELAAERLADAPAGSEVVLLTDLAFDAAVDPRGFAVPVRVEALAPPAAGARVNTAIVAADARAGSRGASDQVAPDAVEVFVSVAHFGPSPREVFVTAEALYDAELDDWAASAPDASARVLASQRVLVEPGAPTPVVLRADLPPDAEGQAPLLVLRLTGDAPDALAADDVVVLPSPGRQRLPVFMVGDVPRVVARVFELDPGVELFETSLSRLAERGDDVALDGLVVYAGATPSAAPGGPVVVVRPSGPDVFGAPLGAGVPRAVVTRWQEDDALLRFVALGDLELAEVRPLGGDVRPLVHTAAGVAVGVLPRVNGDVTIVATDPDRGRWARTPGFVIFFRNLLDQARALRAAGGIPQAELGAALRVVAPDGAEVVVRSPDGATLRGVSRAGMALVPVPPVSGVFVARVGDAERVGLRHVLRSEASDLQPRAQVLERRGAASPPDEGAPSALTGAVDVERALYPLLALALLLVAALEVAWATRRGAA